MAELAIALAVIIAILWFLFFFTALFAFIRVFLRPGIDKRFDDFSTTEEVNNVDLTSPVAEDECFAPASSFSRDQQATESGAPLISLMPY